MKVLVLGGGGREHALAWRLSRDPQVDQVFVIPGNAGMFDVAQVEPDVSLSDFDSLTAYADRNGVDLTVVGPEQPLVDGVVDHFQAQGRSIFGPTMAGAQVEGSKAFTKNLLAESGIATAAFDVFDNEDDALARIRTSETPIVVKADGLAGGKGVFVCSSRDEAEAGVRACFSERRFGSAGDLVVIEECLSGYEVSVLALTDGTTVVPLAPAQDYKRAYDGDKGPNTGGMGCYSPVPLVSKELYSQISREILYPSIEALRQRGIDYRGVLYAGIMVTEEGPSVLEFNCRFGDPEAEVVLPRLEGSLAELLVACVEGRLENRMVSFCEEVCVNVVVASGGYPGAYGTGLAIDGLDDASAVPGVRLFHAGTAAGDSGIVSDGGRVLNVAAVAATFSQARERAYQAIGKIHFDDMQYRTDIAQGVDGSGAR